MNECYSLDIGTITTDRQAAQLQTEEAGPHPISQRCPVLGREHGGSTGGTWAAEAGEAKWQGGNKAAAEAQHYHSP